VRPAAAAPATVANVLHFSKQGSLIPTRGATTPVYVMGRLRTMSTRQRAGDAAETARNRAGARVPRRSTSGSLRTCADGV
jgi:hypothetical protein